MACHVALVVLVVGLIVMSATLWTARARRIALTVGTVMVVALVAVPWHPSAPEPSATPPWEVATDPLWERATAGEIDNVYSDGSRVIYTDDDGIHAVDLRDGSELWSHEGPDDAESIYVATDGHVLVRFGDAPGVRDDLWISPQGDVLWNSSTTGDSDTDMDVDDFSFHSPIASSSGSLVVVTCEDRQDLATCRYLGIAPDGSERWSLDGATRPSIYYSEYDLGINSAREIPEVAVVHSGVYPEDGDLTPATLVDPAEGTTVATIEFGEGLAVVGDTVVYEAGPAAEAGLCRLRGLSVDGDVSWKRVAPCLSAGMIILDRRIYGNLEDAEGSVATTVTGEAVYDSFAMDPSTGRWQNVGTLAYFNHDDAARRAGVPGTDVVVQRHDQRLTRIDPESGEEGWTFVVPGPEFPGVEAAHGAAAVVYRPDAGSNASSSGEHRPRGMGVVAVDTRTGRITGTYLSPTDIWDAVPVAPGQVLISQGDRISLIGTNPS